MKPDEDDVEWVLIPPGEHEIRRWVRMAAEQAAAFQPGDEGAVADQLEAVMRDQLIRHDPSLRGCWDEADPAAD